MQVIYGITAVLVSIIIGFVYSWQVTLLGILMLIILTIGQLFLAHQVMVTNMRLAQSDEAGRIAIEIIENVRTIQLLTREPFFNQRYVRASKKQKNAEMVKCYYESANNSLTQSFLFYMCAVCYGLGIHIISEGQKTASDTFQ